MSFSSVSFIVFLIAVFLIYWEIPHKFRYILLICANVLFYSCFGLTCLPILIAEALMAYLFAKVLERTPKTDDEAPKMGDKARMSSKKDNKYTFLLISGVVFTIAPLLIFKYLNFTIYTADKVASKLTGAYVDHTLTLLAPIGISFYTFEALSYILDVYKGKISAEKNFLKLFAFISFFPNITSGPIERAGDFIPQLEVEKTFSYEKSTYGFRLILLGLVKKICGADVLKQYVDAVFGNIYAYKGPAFIVAIVLYTYEIYLDFSGYTDMARGAALILGFDLTENFKAPYLSNGIKEFFGRWHISLSQWLRDYIYIPLGGSRCSKIRKYINLMITFLVSGIWHGASFTFIVWGLLHGVYQCLADIFAGLLRRIPKPVRILGTFVLVSFAWMFFRANSLTDAKYIALNMIIGDNFYGQMLQMGFLNMGIYVGVISIISLTIVYDIVSEKADIIAILGEQRTLVRWVIYVVAGVLILTLRAHIGASADFIYFSF